MSFHNSNPVSNNAKNNNEQLPQKNLLDFNDVNNFEVLIKIFNRKKLNELNKSEFWKLFKIATTSDIRKKK